jgi:CitMHS family citrate-Mg2+:H+ or citrate-Ca2+:H+ symporter
MAIHHESVKNREYPYPRMELFMLTLIGLTIIVTIISLLIQGKATPVIVLAVVPLVGALIAGYPLTEISLFFEKGIGKVAKVATMFLFAILFFSIMKEQRIFEPLINLLLKLTRGNVVIVAIVTTLISALVHLDGAGAATFLIIIPALLPLYQRLGMNPYLMLLLMCTSMGIMNMVPWGGPLGRASAVVQIDATTLWHQLIPVQLLALASAIIFSVMMGIRENLRIKKLQSHHVVLQENTTLAANQLSHLGETATSSEKKNRYYLANLLLLGVTILCLVLGIISAAYLFIIAFSIALCMNYRHPKQQAEVINLYAPHALNMVAIIFAAGAFLGIMTEGGILTSIASDITTILPQAWISRLHILVGLLGVPLDMVTSTDAYYFALLPIIQQITATVGINADAVVYAMAIGNNAGTFISPFSPALWLALSLSGTEMGKHLRYSFFPIWGASFVTLGFGYLLGLY